MSESNSNVIPAINAVDGFNPADFVRTTVGEEGENDLYLDVKYRLLWFRLHHPNGKIDPELIRVDEKNAIVCCRIYADKADPADQFIGKAYSQRFSTEDRFGDRFLEIAETVAKGRALADAGYGTQFCMNGETLASIIADNQKFYNLTSVDQYYGTQSKCCPHYVGVHEGDEVVCLTEGVMKSDLAYSFAQGSPYECGFVGLTGIPSYSQYERALEELDSIGVKRINVMVDSDYQVKEEVRKARDRYIEMGAAAGFEMAPITWTQKQKGVDDLYKHLFRDK